VVEQEVADEMNQGATEASSADEGEDEVFRRMKSLKLTALRQLQRGKHQICEPDF